MALTNAQRQAAWRQRRERELKKLRTVPPVEQARRTRQEPARETDRVRELESEIEDLQNEVRDLRKKNEELLRVQAFPGLLREMEPLLKGLEAEGKKNMATMSPGTVASLAARLRLLIDSRYRLRIEARKARSVT
jgi:predicted  nucleic acid-binding Zn-ribbon protein